MDFGQRALGRIAMPHDVAEETASIRLIASFLMLTGKSQRTICEGLCFLQATSEQIRFPQR